MRGPPLISNNKLFEFYENIVRNPLSFSEKDLAKLTQYARLDPRLAEVVTEHIRDYWWKYEPKILNSKLKLQPWPTSIRPMLNQILEFCSADKNTKKYFCDWMKQVLAGISVAMPQLYFTTTTRPRGKHLDREVTESLPSFSKAGYFSKDIMFNKGVAGSIKAFPKHTSGILSSENLIKLDLLSKIRPLIAKKTLEEIKNEIGIDRTTMSKLRMGKLDSVSVKKLAEIMDLLRNSDRS